MGSDLEKAQADCPQKRSTSFFHIQTSRLEKWADQEKDTNGQNDKRYKIKKSVPSVILSICILFLTG